MLSREGYECRSMQTSEIFFPAQTLAGQPYPKTLANDTSSVLGFEENNGVSWAICFTYHHHHHHQV